MTYKRKPLSLDRRGALVTNKLKDMTEAIETAAA